MLAQPFFTHDTCDIRQFTYMFPLGLGFTAVPSIIAAYFYQQTARKIESAPDQLKYFGAACTEFGGAVWSTFKVRT